MTADPTRQLLLERDARGLHAAHPPRFRHGHKAAIAERLLGPDVPTPAGKVRVTRWRAAALPPRADHGAPIVRVREGFFAYDPADAVPGEVHWHVNFADPHLFGFYDGPLLAQDELQVLEHPVLGSVREWLVADGHPPLTVEGTEPTPVLVAGAERRGHLRTTLAGPDGRTVSLYGNAFARAPRDHALAALEPVVPPTRSNILAIAAPRGGRGTYTREQVAGALRTAHTGFRAAVLESRALGGHDAAAVVHTGWWGCGAFGGNRTLMAIVQLEAARLAGVAAVHFFAGPDGDGTARRALARWNALRAAHDGTDALIDALVAERLAWGVGDGN